MQRYFIEVAYNGTQYSGFQVQENATTIQGAIEGALSVFFRTPIQLTGSSRTDAGVHALQNYFHTDTNLVLQQRHVYHLNALLPADIVIKTIAPVPADAHCRFDAIYRAYKYYIITSKSPFHNQTAWLYPYTVNIAALNEAAKVLTQYTDFTSFSKKHTQVNNFHCNLLHSEWTMENNSLVYSVSGNRFLRGMVRGLVGTMLQVGRGKLSVQQFCNIIEAKDCQKADFSTPAKGLFLEQVVYPQGYFSRH